MPCPRDGCRGWILHDGDRQVCSLCSRVTNNPQPLPWVDDKQLKHGHPTEAEKRDRYRERQRRYQARRYAKVKNDRAVPA